MPSNRSLSNAISVTKCCQLVRELLLVHNNYILILLPDLINPNGTGYLQESFSFKCPNPHIFGTITKETLAVRKLASDLAGPSAAIGLT